METTWVYVKSEPQLFTVGFYDPSGQWQTDSDHDTRESAANRCATLNGAQDEGYPGIAHDLETARNTINRIQGALGTGEEGENLVAVARDAHTAEMELAAIRRGGE